MALYSMENPIQKYDWGDAHFLPGLLGRGNPSGEPWAELWMGAHPAAPSTVRVPGGEALRLDALIAGDPQGTLGRQVASRWHGRLPFMLKAMSVSGPMSIHAHPGRVKAERGYRREETLFIPFDAPERNYRDENQKPEVVVALTRFEGLCGFREIGEIIANIRLVAPESWRSFAGRLAASPGKLELSVLFYNIISSKDARKAELIRSIRSRAERILADGPDPGPSARETFGTMLMLMDRFPDDMGALAPIIMNLFSLEPGQGLYIAPGEPHSYFGGAAMELEANSDNRIRGGLSRKYLDLPEFLSVMVFDTGARVPIAASPGPGGWSAWHSPAPEFELANKVFAAGKEAEPRPSRAALPEIIFCAQGSLRLTGGDGCALDLAQGSSAFIPASEAAYSIEGAGSAFRARPGIPA